MKRTGIDRRAGVVGVGDWPRGVDVAVDRAAPVWRRVVDPVGAEADDG